MLRKIATTAVYVTDQQKALEFWTRQVGFELRASRPMGPGGSWIEVAPPGGESCLVLYPRAMMDDWAERKPSIVFSCDDIEATCKRLKEANVHFVEELKTMKWGSYAKFADPDGNEFLLKD